MTLLIWQCYDAVFDSIFACFAPNNAAVYFNETGHTTDEALTLSLTAYNVTSALADIKYE